MPGSFLRMGGITSNARRVRYAVMQDRDKGLINLSDNALSRLTDGSENSHWEYTIWKSTRSDSTPDLTMYMSGDSIRYIWIRPGKRSGGYYDNARPCTVEVRVYGNSTKYTSVTLSDSSYGDVGGFQCIDLGSTCAGVTSVEFFFRDFYIGNGSSKYNMCISDIIMN